MSIERWKQIVYRGRKIRYDVSSHGRIRHHGTKRIREPYVHKRSGRRVFQFRTADQKNHTIFIAQRVAAAFKREPRPGEQLEHKDQCKTNDHNSNLRWMTQSENILRSYRLTGRKSCTGRRLSPAAYELIFRLWRSGYSQVKIGKALGLTNGSVCNIVNGRGEALGTRNLDCNWSALGLNGPEDL